MCSRITKWALSLHHEVPPFCLNLAAFLSSECVANLIGRDGTKFCLSYDGVVIVFYEIHPCLMALLVTNESHSWCTGPAAHVALEVRVSGMVPYFIWYLLSFTVQVWHCLNDATVDLQVACQREWLAAIAFYELWLMLHTFKLVFNMSL